MSSRLNCGVVRVAGLGTALLIGGLIFALAGPAAAGDPLKFPAAPLETKKTAAGVVKSYDVAGRGKADFFTLEDDSGRITRIAYDTTGKGEPDEVVNLDEIPVAQARHVVFILDGFGFEMVEALRQEGRLRMFYPPNRLITTYPSMTDLALSDAFRGPKCAGFEAVYYDRKAGKVVGGDSEYLAMKNAEWHVKLDFRLSSFWDAFCYLYPESMLNKEFGEELKLFDERKDPDLILYSIASAGMGTRLGRDGQHKTLEGCDRLFLELLWKTHGRVKFTMFADHGHTLQREERVDFPKFLKEQGWHVVDSLSKPRDVAVIEYGLVVYTAFATDDKPGLVATLVTNPGVDLVTYADGQAAVVEKTDGKALIEKRGTQYRYRPLRGDPLELGPIIEKMRADKVIDAEGYAEDKVWFERTLVHKYPDPLYRVWRCFLGDMVTSPADVIASLKENYYAGAYSRAFWLPYVASTHGDLAQKSSTPFIMSSISPVLPPGVGARHSDVPAIMERLTGRPWPPARQESK
jgi:hypothetical protein